MLAEAKEFLNLFALKLDGVMVFDTHAESKLGIRCGQFTAPSDLSAVYVRLSLIHI
jgi:hypothetical protein